MDIVFSRPLHKDEICYIIIGVIISIYILHSLIIKYLSIKETIQMNSFSYESLNDFLNKLCYLYARTNNGPAKFQIEELCEDQSDNLKNLITGNNIPRGWSYEISPDKKTQKLINQTIKIIRNVNCEYKRSTASQYGVFVLLLQIQLERLVNKN